MFNPFEELFAPGRKHTRDEQKRLELTREDVGDNDPGRGPIDLTSGKAVIRAPAPAAPEAQASGSQDPAPRGGGDPADGPARDDPR